MSLSERLFVRLVSAVRTMADPQAKARAARAFAPEPHRRHLELLARPATIRALAYSSLLTLIVTLASTSGAPFIYFQF